MFPRPTSLQDKHSLRLYRQVILRSIRTHPPRNHSISLKRLVFLWVKTYLLLNNTRSLNRLVFLRRVKTYLLRNN